MPTKKITNQKELIAAWRNDPLLLHRQLFDNRLWAKQIEVLESLRDNPRTAVKSGNTVGKSRIAAEAALWFMLTHYPSKVITTAPTWTQVESILWKEIGTLYNQAKIPIGADLLKTELKFNDEWFAIGISTNEVNRFQGFHSPYLLVILDEALGVEPAIWEAMEGLHPYRVLAIGNPLDSVGNFYHCFASSLWNKITISCEECVKWQKANGEIKGLVTQNWINERVDEWGRNSPLYQARVSGEFPEDTVNTLISRKWVEEARNRASTDDEDDSVRITGADIATKHGENETVIGYRFGHTVNEMQGYQRIPTTMSAGIIKRYYEKKDADQIVIDSDGIGEGVADIITAQKIGVTEFHGGYGQKAIDKNRFRNLRTQFYWIVAKKFEKGLYSLKGLPDKEYEILKNQLCCIKLKPPDAQGRIQIETKEDLMARGIKSPDFADCFVYMEYGFWCGKYMEIKSYCYR